MVLYPDIYDLGAPDLYIDTALTRHSSSSLPDPPTAPAHIDFTPLSPSLTLDTASAFRLPYPWNHEVIRSVAVADDAIFSGGEDGYLRGWRREGADDVDQKGMENLEISREGNKRSRNAGAEGGGGKKVRK